jgi:hypothetical protein
MKIKCIKMRKSTAHCQFLSFLSRRIIKPFAIRFKSKFDIGESFSFIFRRFKEIVTIIGIDGFSFIISDEL